jgi:hypothetical protein
MWNDPIILRLVSSLRIGISGLSGIHLLRGSRLNLLISSAPAFEVPKQPVLICTTQLAVSTPAGRNGKLAVRVPCCRSGFLCGRNAAAHYEKDDNVGDPQTQ